MPNLFLSGPSKGQLHCALLVDSGCKPANVMTRQRVQLYQLVAFHPVEAGPLAAFYFANWGANGIEIFNLL